MTDILHFNISEIKLSTTSLFSVQIMSYLGASKVIYSDVIDSFISEILKYESRRSFSPWLKYPRPYYSNHKDVTHVKLYVCAYECFPADQSWSLRVCVKMENWKNVNRMSKNEICIRGVWKETPRTNSSIILYSNIFSIFSLLIWAESSCGSYPKHIIATRQSTN